MYCSCFQGGVVTVNYTMRVFVCAHPHFWMLLPKLAQEREVVSGSKLLEVERRLLLIFNTSWTIRPTLDQSIIWRISTRVPYHCSISPTSTVCVMLTPALNTRWDCFLGVPDNILTQFYRVDMNADTFDRTTTTQSQQVRRCKRQRIRRGDPAEWVTVVAEMWIDHVKSSCLSCLLQYLYIYIYSCTVHSTPKRIEK